MKHAAYDVLEQSGRREAQFLCTGPCWWWPEVQVFPEGKTCSREDGIASGNPCLLKIKGLFTRNTFSPCPLLPSLKFSIERMVVA